MKDQELDVLPQRRQLLMRRSCPYPLGNYAQPVPSPHQRCHQDGHDTRTMNACRTPRSGLEDQNSSWFSRRSPIKSPLSDTSPPGGGTRNISLWSNSSIDERMEADDECMITGVDRVDSLPMRKPKEEPTTSLMDSFMASLSFGGSQSGAQSKRASLSPRKHDSIYEYVPDVGAGSIKIENALHGWDDDVSSRRVGRSRSLYAGQDGRLSSLADVSSNLPPLSSECSLSDSFSGAYFSPGGSRLDSVLRRRSDYVSDRTRSPGKSVKSTSDADLLRATSQAGEQRGCCVWMLSILYRTIVFLLKTLFILLIMIGALLVVRHGYVAYMSYSASSCEHYSSVNLTQLDTTLHRDVFGQHLVVNRLLSVLDHFFTSLIPQRPLVLSFHGWTGIGKNYVSEIIGEHVRSASVHKIIIPLHFPHGNEADEFSQRLERWIMSNISSCALNLFIVDEVDKASWDILPTLVSVLTTLRRDSPAEHKVIVILLSNTRSVWINQYTFSWLTNGGLREEIPEDELLTGLLREDSDVSEDWHIQLNQLGLIDDFLIFLPLEQSHVELCIKQDLLLKKRTVTPSLLQHIIESVTFVPNSNPIFSLTGCRKVTTTVDVTEE